MSSCLLVHLSDLHIEEESSALWGTERAERIARSALRNGPYDLVIVALSGDISYSGSAGEYGVAETFLGRLTTEMANLASCEVKVIVAPGNHDCDFSAPSKLREFARSKPSAETVTDLEMLAKLSEPLQNFRKFEGRSESFEFQHRSTLSKTGVVPIGGARLQFKVLTSSLFSEIKERKGELYLPPSVAEGGWTEGCIRVAIMHHPPAWFTDAGGVSRGLRTALRSNAHIVLYGHEHLPELAVIATPSLSAPNQVIEIDGAVLHESAESKKSGFITLEIDTEGDSVEVCRHDYDVASACYVAKLLSEFKRDRGWLKLPPKSSAMTLTETFAARLNDPGVVLSISRATELRAADLYVPPELSIERTVGASAETFSSAKLADPDQLKMGLVVQGDERSGKTSLLFRLFQSYHEAGYAPLYVSLGEHKIRSIGDFRKVISSSLEQAYASLNTDQFAAIGKDKKIFLVDDIDLVPKPLLRAALIDMLRAQASGFVVTTTLRAQMTEVLTDDDDGAVSDIRQAKIGKMTAVMRGQLIQKWVTNVESVSEGEQLLGRIDRLEKSAAMTLGHNLVPRVPHMLLLFLQSSLASGNSNLESGALGHYYEFLVNQSLLAAGVKSDELDEPNSFARAIAFEMHCAGTNYLSTTQLEKCNAVFSQEYFPRSLQSRLNVLRHAKLLVEFGSDSFQWREPYSQYLFLGGYLSRNMNRLESRQAVSEMVSHLYVRANANGLLFLMHFSKDAEVFNDLTNVLAGLFKADDPLRLGIDTKEFSNIIRNADSLIAGTDPLIERERRNAARDRSNDDDGMKDEKSGAAVLTLLEEVMILFKTTEIVGQVLKDQYASIRRVTREPIVEALLQAYLRACGGLIRKLAVSSKFLQRQLERSVDDKAEPLSQGDRVLAAQALMANLVQVFMFAFFQKLAEGIASEKTLDLIRHIDWKVEYESKVLILACEANVQRPIPFAQLDELLKFSENDPALFALVRNLIQVRIRLFHTRASELQALASRFKLKVGRLNMIDFKEPAQR